MHYILKAKRGWTVLPYIPWKVFSYLSIYRNVKYIGQIFNWRSRFFYPEKTCLFFNFEGYIYFSMTLSDVHGVCIIRRKSLRYKFWVFKLFSGMNLFKENYLENKWLKRMVTVFIDFFFWFVFNVMIKNKLAVFLKYCTIQ